jgi:hypothetical protein
VFERYLWRFTKKATIQITAHNIFNMNHTIEDSNVPYAISSTALIVHIVAAIPYKITTARLVPFFFISIPHIPISQLITLLAPMKCKSWSMNISAGRIVRPQAAQSPAGAPTAVMAQPNRQDWVQYPIYEYCFGTRPITL